MICDGTIIRWVTFSRSIASMNSTGSNFFCRTYVAPRKSAGKSVTKAPLNTSDPAWRTTLSGVMRNVDANSAQYIARMSCVWTIPLGTPVVPLLYMMLNG